MEGEATNSRDRKSSDGPEKVSFPMDTAGYHFLASDSDSPRLNIPICAFYFQTTSRDFPRNSISAGGAAFPRRLLANCARKSLVRNVGDVSTLEFPWIVGEFPLDIWIPASLDLLNARVVFQGEDLPW
jgi:hypothetical protein